MELCIHEFGARLNAEKLFENLGFFEKWKY